MKQTKTNDKNSLIHETNDIDELNSPNHIEPRRNVVTKVILMSLCIVIIGFGAFYFWWTMYAVFEYELQPVVIIEGVQVTPDNFLPESEKEKGITAIFLNPRYIPVPGVNNVELSLKYGMRSLKTTVFLYVLSPARHITHEFREVAPELKAIDLLTNAHIAENIPYNVHFIEEPLQLHEYEIGEYTLLLELNAAPFHVLLSISDTTPPTADVVSVEKLVGEDISPEDFVTNVFDHSPYAIAFLGEIDSTLPEQIVEIIIEDIYGNSYIYASSLSLKLNKEPPTLHGIPDIIESMVGTTIMYRAGVTAFDDFGRDLTEYITVDTSNVDQNTIGKYSVIYSVKDFTGFVTSSKETYVFITDVTAEVLNFVNEWADKKLASILTSAMTQTQQARAIYSAVRETIFNYNIQGVNIEKSVYDAANHAIRFRQGDCYSFYALSEILLTRAGIPNMYIERIDDPTIHETRHFWNLINPDGLGWHHFDANGWTTDWAINSTRYMFTQSQAEHINRFMSQTSYKFRNRDYYDYDPSLYPEIVYEQHS